MEWISTCAGNFFERGRNRKPGQNESLVKSEIFPLLLLEYAARIPLAFYRSMMTAEKQRLQNEIPKLHMEGAVTAGE